MIGSGSVSSREKRFFERVVVARCNPPFHTSTFHAESKEYRVVGLRSLVRALGTKVGVLGVPKFQLLVSGITRALLGQSSRETHGSVQGILLYDCAGTESVYESWA